MFPLIPALILFLLHGSAHFDKLAETGRLPASLAVFRSDVVAPSSQPEVARQSASRRALATLIAATGDRALAEAFATMFLPGDIRPVPTIKGRRIEPQPKLVRFDDHPPAIPEGFSKFVRSRDGPAIA